MQISRCIKCGLECITSETNCPRCQSPLADRAKAGTANPAAADDSGSAKPPVLQARHAALPSARPIKISDNKSGETTPSLESQPPASQPRLLSAAPTASESAKPLAERPQPVEQSANREVDRPPLRPDFDRLLDDPPAKTEAKVKALPPAAQGNQKTVLWIIVSVVMVGVVAVIIWLLSGRERETSQVNERFPVSGNGKIKPGDSASDFQLSANELVAAYESNRTTADQKYKDSMIEITGLFERSDNQGVLLSAAGKIQIRCQLPREDKYCLEQINYLRAGETVIFKGLCNGLQDNAILICPASIGNKVDNGLVWGCDWLPTNNCIREYRRRHPNQTH